LVILNLMADHESRESDRRETAAASDRHEQRSSELRHYVPQEILDVSFPGAVRGYDRTAVDAYVKRVNRVIAELKVSASPPHAVRHALEQAEEKIQGLLRAGREAADQITASAQQDAERSTGLAKAEAAELVVDASAEAERVEAESAQLVASTRAETESMVAAAQADVDERRRRLQEQLAERRNEAETRLRAIRADTEAVRARRRELLDDISRLGSILDDLVAEAGDRFDEPTPHEPTEAVDDGLAATLDGDLSDELADRAVSRHET
jgi:DivIVA domain-containing protein